MRLLRPSEPEELFAVAAAARGDAPYWAELWPCARSLAAHLASLDLAGMRVLELGCGLAPALARRRAARRRRGRQRRLADALERVAESGRRTLGRPLETLCADLHAPAALLERGPFDLVLGADLLYDRTLAEAMGALIPQIAPAALFAYAWRGSAIPLAEPLAAQGFRIAQWRPGGAGPRLFEAVRGRSESSTPLAARAGARGCAYVMPHTTSGAGRHVEHVAGDVGSGYSATRTVIGTSASSGTQCADVDLAREHERRPHVERHGEGRDADALHALPAPAVRAERAQHAPVRERLDADLLVRLAQGRRQQIASPSSQRPPGKPTCPDQGSRSWRARSISSTQSSLKQASTAAGRPHLLVVLDGRMRPVAERGLERRERGKRARPRGSIPQRPARLEFDRVRAGLSDESGRGRGR